MKNSFRSVAPWLLSLFIAVFFAACDTTDNPTEPDPDVQAPADLKAYSLDGKIGLVWTLSSSESQTNFGVYEITAVESQTSANPQVRTVAKGVSNYVFDGLTNGTRYTIMIRAKTSKGKTSANQATVEWSPAVRNTNDISNKTIDIYATTSSTKPSGILFNGTGNKVEVISQAGADWKQRGDAYFYTTSTSDNTLKIMSADLAQNNTGMKTTYFSTVSYDANDLDASTAQTSAPPAATYTSQKLISIIDQVAPNGKVYWARIQGAG